MYFLNYLHTISNLSRLIKIELNRESNLESLQTDYREFIHKKRLNTSSSGYSIHFEDDVLGLSTRSSGFFNGIFSNISSTTNEERKAFKENISAAFLYIQNVDARLAWITETLITDIILFQSDKFGGGSASHLPGLVCVSPKESWEIKDFAESLLHEAIHLNLFIGDMIHGLYSAPLSELEQESSRVVSAVKIGELRPLDKALHSAAVAVPLMYLQHKTKETTLVDLFTDSLYDCARGLAMKHELLTEYGREVVQQLYSFAKNQDFKLLEDAIGSPIYQNFDAHESFH